MKTKKMLISIGIILGFAGSFFAKGAEAIGTKTIEPVLVFEYKFDEPIVDVIFDEATMTVKEARALGMRGLEERKATEKVRVQYPKIIITKKAVRFLDKRWKVERQVSYKGYRAQVSLSAGKIVITDSYGEEEEYASKIIWIDEKGKVVKTISGGEFDGAMISGNGKYVAVGQGVISGDPTDCRLYDIDGRKLWKYPFNRLSYDGLRYILYDGKVVIIEYGEERVDKGKILLIDTTGKKLWECELEISSNVEIHSTLDGKIIVYVEDFDRTRKLGEFDKERYKLYGFDKDGKFLWQPKEYIGFNNSFHMLAISKENNYLTGLTLWDHLWIMDINTGKFLWKYPLKGEKPDTLQISSDGKYILLGETTLLGGKKLGKPTLIDAENGKVLRQFEREESGELLGTNKILRKKGNKIKIFNIPDILKEKD